MATLTIPDNKAREIYPSASAELKIILENSLGKDFFSQKITDRVKSFENACAVLALNPDSLLSLEDTPDEKAYKQLKVIIKALNEGWTPDWNNSSQYKYYPWFYMDSDHGFVLDCVNYCCSNSTVGSRLCFKSRELAQYAAKQFLELYKAFFTL